MAGVTQGSSLTAHEILSTPDLIAVGMQGDDVLRRMHGARTTFVRVFDVHVDAPVSSMPAGVSAGEIRIVGTPADRDAAIGAVERMAALAQTRVPVTGFSLSDLRSIAPTADAFVELCRALGDKGLFAVADTPLDMFLDESAEEYVGRARAAGLNVSRLTVHAALEPGPADVDRRVEAVERASRLQQDLGGFRVFAPLPRKISSASPTTGYADVRQVALARVIVSNIESIQIDWPLYGPKLAQVALTVGADDVDGVSALDDGALGTRRSPIQEITNNIRAAALEPVERNGRFELMT
jgi:hypothetical protein